VPDFTTLYCGIKSLGTLPTARPATHGPHPRERPRERATHGHPRGLSKTPVFSAFLTFTTFRGHGIGKGSNCLKGAFMSLLWPCERTFTGGSCPHRSHPVPPLAPYPTSRTLSHLSHPVPPLAPCPTSRTLSHLSHPVPPLAHAPTRTHTHPHAPRRAGAGAGAHTRVFIAEASTKIFRAWRAQHDCVVLVSERGARSSPRIEGARPHQGHLLPERAQNYFGSVLRA
jgi:hypothetical protein